MPKPFEPVTVYVEVDTKPQDVWSLPLPESVLEVLDWCECDAIELTIADGGLTARKIASPPRPVAEIVEQLKPRRRAPRP